MANEPQINIYGKNATAASPPVKKWGGFVFNFLL